MFKVTFTNLNYEFDAQKDIKSIIISLIKKNHKITRREMVEYVAKPTIERLLKNQVKYVGSSKGALGNKRINIRNYLNVFCLVLYPKKH